jgi:hypothetical protein
MMTIWDFYYNCIARGKIKFFGIPIEFFATVFESDFYNFERTCSGHIHIGKPIEHIHFIAPACTAGSIIIAAGNLVAFLCSA